MLDVTLRDGGYVNGHSWTTSDAMSIVSACAAAGVPRCEVGYYRPRIHGRDDRRPTATCPPAFLEELREHNPDVTLGVMAHLADLDVTDYAQLAARGVGLVRFPARVDVLDALAPHVDAARAAGLAVSVNLIRVSEVEHTAAVRAAVSAERFGANVFYLADSNGSLFPVDVERLVRDVTAAVTIPVGFHAHDGLSLAFINSLTAFEHGCRWLDGSLAGMGKGGGNLSLELIAGYLRTRSFAPLSMVPLAVTAASVLEPWRGGVATRCESMATSLLDLNIDAIAEARGGETPQLVSLVDAGPAA